MLKRPTSRRRSNRSQVYINLVPILDAMVTLIAFLLFTMSFLNLVHIESPFPESSEKVLQEKLKERPLQLTVTLRETEARIWSPFSKFEPKTVPNTPDGYPDYHQIHQALVEIKQKFITENKIVIVPNAATTYDILIAAMDTMRTLEPTDPPMFVKNAVTGMDEPLKALFPDVIFGNLLGDS